MVAQGRRPATFSRSGRWPRRAPRTRPRRRPSSARRSSPAGRSRTVRSSITVWPRVSTPAVSTATWRRRDVNRCGCVNASTASGSWIGGPVDALAALAIRAREERQQLGEQRGETVAPSPRPMAATCSMRSGVARNWWVTSSPGHHERPAVAEHDGSGLGIGPDVELGGGRAVAERAATHQRDAGDAPRRDRARRAAPSAMLVSGPIGTSHTPSRPRQVSMMNADGVGRRRADGSAPAGRRRRAHWRRGRRRRAGLGRRAGARPRCAPARRCRAARA